MRFNTHVVGGLSAGIFTNSYLIEYATNIGNHTSTILISSVLIAGSVIGSITPDIDHKGSYISRHFKIPSFLFRIVSFVFSFIYQINRKVFKFGDNHDKNMITHRGITHTPILVLGILSILLFLSMHVLSGENSILLSCLSIGFGVGMLSHIFLDSLTKGGAPLLYPITTKSFSFLPIKTGGIVETFIRLAILVGTFGFILAHYELFSVVKLYF